MKACQQWITSDEDIDEEVESAMTLIFVHLAPILQNVPGAHWDFVFDVLENNLEVRENRTGDIDYLLIVCARRIPRLLTMRLW